MAELCARCQRLAPSWDAHEYLEWEAIDYAGGIICPGCLTALEQGQIDRSDEQTEMEARAAAERELPQDDPAGGDA